MITFQHRSDVRRIMFGEFDLPMASQILLEAKSEVNEACDEALAYEFLIKRAQQFLIFGDDESEEE